MTQDKELLLKDLCARLPYGVKVAFFNEDLTLHSEHRTLIGIECINNLNYSRLEDEDGNTTIVEFVKPYLFPLSSMTEEHKKELEELGLAYYTKCEDIDDDGVIWVEKVIQIIPGTETDDWLLEHHFDHRGLIEKSLALDATNLRIYE